MSKEIKVNQMAVEANVEAISGVNQYLEETALTLADNRTTVTVNSKAQEAYAKSQKVKKCLGNMMQQEVSNIRSLGVMFRQYDNMLSELWQNGLEKTK